MPAANILASQGETSPPPEVLTPRGCAQAQLHPPPSGQLLLGTDKRNPVFAVYEDDRGERLLVFYGFELIEIVNNSPEHPAFKLLFPRRSVSNSSSWRVTRN